MQAHVRSDLWKSLGEEMRGAHPRLQRCKRVLHRLPSLASGIDSLIEPSLHPIEHGLMFPASDAAIVPQYSAEAYQTVLAEHGISVNMSGKVDVTTTRW